MTLSAALFGALSGLNAQGRASGIVSENIANALTPGYARRSLELASQGDRATGVRVIGINRHVDPAIIANRRSADADLGHASTIASFQTRLAAAIGGPLDAESLTSRIAAFSESLISAASRPESAERLDATVLAAKELAEFLHNASDTVQAMRSEADRRIAIQVDRINVGLQQVQELNGRIVTTGAAGGSIASLLDQRQVVIDEINEYVPINIVHRDRGAVALYADGGAILLDGNPATLSFTPSNAVVAGMSLSGGTLSGLEINGRAVRTDSQNSAVIGGSLSAQFEIRDELGTAAQSELDALARDLMERFEDPGLDATLAPGSPGLFTDNGAAFDPLNELGLAWRLEVNTAVDPSLGGDSWRMRDGLGAAVPGPPGDARFLQSLQAALLTRRTPATGSFGTGLLSAPEIGSAVISRIGETAHRAEQRLSFASASQTEMAQIELERGVDTDHELGRLIQIEQVFAANARMLQVVDDLMENLLRI